MPEIAANRILDTKDLRQPTFRNIILKMENLLREHSWLYLHPSKRWEYPWALHRARLATGSRVLDAGCGASIFPVNLGMLQLKVAALDWSLPHLRQTRSNPQLTYVRGIMQHMPFADNAFDAVFCISVIEHLPIQEMIPALEELARVLKPGGRLLLTTDYAEDAAEPLRYEGPGKAFPVDWNLFDRPRLERLLDAVTDLEVEGELNLKADWSRIREEMRRFHGYPYTSVGIAFRKLS